jgi:hypothetical protein
MNRQIGVFSGGFDVVAAETFEGWAGPIAFNVDFAQITKPSNNVPWLVGEWQGMLSDQPHHNMLFSIPMDGFKVIGSGVNDAAFKLAAQAIAAKYPNAIVRIGWEMNGSWYEWSCNFAGAHAMYAAAFRRIALIFRAVSAGFKFCWCPDATSTDPNIALCYPGDDVVDIIGLDVYTDYSNFSKGMTPINSFAAIKAADCGITWMENFATLHAKPTAFPEWGVNADDPYFIEHMAQHFTGTTGFGNYLLASYWDSNSGITSKLSPGTGTSQYPNAAAAYLANWKTS